MAFSKTPVQSTYSTERINIVDNLQQRDNSDKDYRLVNLMIETVESPATGQKTTYVKSRPGLHLYTAQTAGEGRGIYYMEDTDSLFYVIGNRLYRNTTLVGTLDTSTGTVGFTTYLDNLERQMLFFCDGQQGYLIPTPATPTITRVIPGTWTASTAQGVSSRVIPTVSNGLVYVCSTAGTTGSTQPTWPTTIGATVTDGSVVWTCKGLSFPVPHIPQPVFLDGYILLAKANSQDIYNSDLNDTLAWTAGNYITAEMYGDNIVGLTRNNNYVYAVGSSSVEYFFDAANATGSPLARQDSAVQQFGAAARDTIVQTDKEVIMVGAQASGGHTVWTIDGFKAKEIGTSVVKRALTRESTYISQAKAFSVRCGGQKLYVLCLHYTTLVYSFETQMWHIWGSGPANVPFVNTFAADSPYGYPYVQSKDTGAIYVLDEAYYTDEAQLIYCQLTTNKEDFGSLNRKFMHRFGIIGDVPDNQTVSVQWSDDDYRTWSTAQTLNFNADLPVLFQLGNFRRRAFRISYAQNSLFRIMAFEVDINKGSA